MAMPRDDELDDLTKPTPGWTVEWVDETDSTQNDLLQRCDDGTLVDRTARAALYQSRGRGRLDRTWEAPPGSNLLVSLGFVRPLHDPGATMRAAALAVVATARRYACDAVIKWPNDVLVDGAKLAGLIAQRHETGDVVVGVGVNVNWAPPGAARLADGDGTSLALDEVLRELLGSFDTYYNDHTAELDQDAISAAYRTSLATIGQRVRVELFDSDLVGIAVDITDDGQLVVDVDGRRHLISAGDVHHLRPA